MDYYEVIRKRRSVRKYQDRDVEEDKLKRILEAARIAPSATNAQPWRFIVVRKKEVREKLKAAYPQPWFWTAPVVICACGITSEAWRRSDGKSYLDVDVAIAMDHLILAATAEGLGTCWIGAFEPFEIKRILNLPPGIEPIALTPLGYPAALPESKSRKPWDEVIQYI